MGTQALTRGSASLQCIVLLHIVLVCHNVHICMAMLGQKLPVGCYLVLVGV
jgi:hypothetical protein